MNILKSRNKWRINEKLVSKIIIDNNGDPKRRLFQHRLLILIITFIIYSTYHISRKSMSVVKSKLFIDVNSTENWSPFEGQYGKSMLSMMDALYWGNYAVFMFFTGYFAERSDLRYFISGALILCGIMCIILGLSHQLKIHSETFFIIMECLNGILQTTGWPTVVAIVGVWFGNRKKGLILGIWNLHTSFGNILGLVIAGAFVDIDWGFSFIIPGLICIVVAILSFLFLIPHPNDIGIDVESIDNEQTTTTTLIESQSSLNHLDKNNNNNNPNDNEKAISFWKALLIPGVIEFAFCLAFTKSVSYIFLNWLPKFLEENDHLSSSSSAYQSIMFDIGGMIGSIIVGLLADRTNSSGIICILFLMLAIPSLFVFEKYSAISKAMNFQLQFIAGFFINGPYALITTAVSANLACKVPSKSAMATVSAIIDGTGSIGAAIGPAITGPLADKFGWNSIFNLSMFMDFFAILCLLRIGYQEIRVFI
ncbi:glucose-6-phosphate exchanger SLC37A2-like [Dermatophagoides pteronyssinus]|uniref:glucose-6-phosphate exchanger SLC37A2-like n=1 Tax=Dermatophagoides pteronyssinus TaxID=6956 RepID=UPI003F669C09